MRVFEDSLYENGGMRSICWSPDDSRIATTAKPPGRHDGKTVILFWDVATGKRTKEVVHNQTGMHATNLHWHPDGDRLLYHCHQTRIFDEVTGTIIREFKGHEGLMSALSPDGSRVLTMTTNELGRSPTGDHHFAVPAVWNAATGEEEFKLKQPAFTALWDPTGQYISAACPDGSARLYDANDGKLIRTMRGHDGWVTVASWTPDGKRLATAGDRGLIKIWDPWTGEEIVSIDSTIGDLIGGLRFSPDGKKLVMRALWGKYRTLILDASKGYQNADTPLTYDPDETPVVRMF